MGRPIVRLTMAFVCGIVSALSTRSLPAVLILTGVWMVLIALEDILGTDEPDNRARRTRFLIATAACALAIALLSGHWWGFAAFACVKLTPFAGALTAMVASGIGAAAGIVSTSLSGTRAVESEGARRIAEMIVMILAVGVCVGVILLLFYLAKRREERRQAEQKRLRDTMIGEMHERRLNRELARQSYAAEQNARLLERENISRNIHNNVGHSITAAVMTLDAADMLFDSKPEEARRRMNDASERIRGSLESIRSAVRALDDEGGEVPVSDLRRYLENVAESFTMDTERRVDLNYEYFSDEILIPKDNAEFLTGVFQECLSNGVRHGGADAFTMTLTADTAHVRLTVTDNGAGDFDEDNRAERIGKGFGLRKILSYAKRCGGKASFSNDGGFRTVVELPLTRAAEDQNG